MRIPKRAAALSALLLLLAFSAAPHLLAEVASPEASPADAVVDEKTVEGVEIEAAEPALEPVSWGLPSCIAVHGTPCQEGQVARCQWQLYEPESCHCTSGTFQCGNLS